MSAQGMANDRIQSIREEIANAVTHGIGLGLSIAGLSTLCVRAARHATVWHVVSFVVFGSSLVILYLSSTLYHGLSYTRARNVLKRLDHISIYVLIAGTYTPFTLTFLRGGLGWTLFGLVWGLAVTGIVFKAIFGGRFATMATFGYLLMGWLILIAAQPLITGLANGGLAWLVAGGLCYTCGIPFYMRDAKIAYFHTVWHLFVLAGSICHYFAVMIYLVR